MSAQDPLPARPAVTPPDDTPRYRSGAVARMVRMPVATLRIWERRYQVTGPATTPTGHRLYSAAQVRRLALLKQLTDLGHAIGSIAALDMERLREVASTHARTLAGPRAAAASVPVPWRVAVIGAALARRLRSPSVLHRLGRPLDIVGPFDSLAEAGDGHGGGAGQHVVDAVLAHAPGLHEDWLAGLRKAAEALGAPRVVVLYGYAAASACRAFTAAGVALLREPQTDTALGQWLRSLGEPATSSLADTALPARVDDPAVMAAATVAPRRYDDATLADFAGLSTTIACECPRHVAELLVQLSHFEAYSSECAQRSPADAVLHAYLQRVAGASRALFEAALEQVAVHEGLVLPA